MQTDFSLLSKGPLVLHKVLFPIACPCTILFTLIEKEVLYC